MKKKQNTEVKITTVCFQFTWYFNERRTVKIIHPFF